MRRTPDLRRDGRRDPGWLHTVTLALSQRRRKVGYKGYVLEGQGAFEKTIPLRDSKN